MSTLALVLLALLLPMVAVALLNLAAAPRLHHVPPPEPGAPEPGTLASVLVPARDEAENLRRLLPALAHSRYPFLEVIVLDDRSSDDSAVVARSHAARDPRVRVVSGTEPPPGWTGKNWACHQLAHAAAGRALIFCDADVVPGLDAVGRTVAALESGADVVTAFPRHERGGWFEDAVVPVIAKLPVAALLPLPLVRHTRAASLAVGNGQWLAWRREAYDAAGGHARVRDDVLEDVGLARGAKEDGLHLAPYIATRDLTVRMYREPRDAWEGFGKNLYPLAGGRDWTAYPALALFVAAMGLPLVLPVAGGGLAWAPLGALLALRTAAALLFGDGVRSVALHPVGVVAGAALLLSSRRRHRQGTVTWKRRALAESGR